MMRRLFCLLTILQALAAAAFAQTSPGQIDLRDTPALHPHHEPELAFGKPTDLERWKAQSPGLHAGFGSTDEAYFRSEVPVLGDSASRWEVIRWRGERLNAIVLVWSTEHLRLYADAGGKFITTYPSTLRGRTTPT
jgi:hypothetical protein